ncbi:MAG TPA: FtsW/RodA/SpoVE family cell cycle protein [Candidatus Faecousia intestinigallinarum]|nr:FtsW/RodA/SpoVE family cell cycle protein [Candidatus Faecousia intestinigallinarum]
MANYLQELRSFFRKGDMILLLLCLITTVFGLLVVASATNAVGSVRFVVMQIAGAGLGVLFYALISSVDVEFLAENRWALVVFNTFLLLLLIPFGEDINGNRSWLNLPLLPFNIQVAEICKITYVLIMASVMASHQNRISSIPSVLHMVLHLGLLVGLNMVLSGDAGVSLIFVFTFALMAFSGGVSLWWFLLGVVGLGAAMPLVWNWMGDYQRLRIEVLFNPDLDPEGIGVRYHTVQSLRSLTGGGWTGQGLFNGNRTQGDELAAGHTDYIFSSIGEELGFVGCAAAILLLVIIILRCIQVGVQSPDYMRRMICFGAASVLMFQLISNVGMCIGITPVIGLTLPFISYGPSSIVTIYAMLGLVSGVHARPSPLSHERYIRPY